MTMLRFLSLLSLLLSFTSLHAQCPRENTAFKAGEQLTYDLYFHWNFIIQICHPQLRPQHPMHYYQKLK